MSERSHGIIGIDPSLTGAGVALIRTSWSIEGETTPQFGVHTFGRPGKKGEPLQKRLKRLETLCDEIRGVVTSEMESPDLALIESPAPNQNSGSHHDRSGLWWFLVRMFDRLGITVMEVPIQTVKKYALGKGVGSKDQVMAAAIRRYPDVPISNNNESDAWVLAAIGARLRGEPVEESLPLTHLAALDKIEIPRYEL
jgi:crossover junction endodeoxyribonuclease RuvC